MIAQSSKKANPLFLRLAAGVGALAIILGAFGAHLLEAQLESTGRLGTWETAVLYHLVHAIALLVLGLRSSLLGALRISFWLWLIGVSIFSGSLYLLCLTGVGWLGAITPLGGLSLIAGWVSLFWVRSR